MKLMILVPPPTGCYGPDAITVDPFYFTDSNEPTTCYNTFDPDSVWTNPCAESYAISYVYKIYYHADTTPVLEYTSGTFTATIPPGASELIDEIGPVEVTISGEGAVAYIEMIVTYPDSSVRTYTSDLQTTNFCT